MSDEQEMALFVPGNYEWIHPGMQRLIDIGWVWQRVSLRSGWWVGIDLMGWAALEMMGEFPHWDTRRERETLERREVRGGLRWNGVYGYPDDDSETEF